MRDHMRVAIGPHTCCAPRWTTYMRRVGPLHAAGRTLTCGRSDPYMRPVGPLHAAGRTLTCGWSDHIRATGRTTYVRPVGPLRATGRTLTCGRSDPYMRSHAAVDHTHAANRAHAYMRHGRTLRACDRSDHARDRSDHARDRSDPARAAVVHKHLAGQKTARVIGRTLTPAGRKTERVFGRTLTPADRKTASGWLVQTHTREVGPNHARDRSDPYMRSVGPCARSVGPLHAIGRTLTCDRSDPYMRSVGPLHAIGRTLTRDRSDHARDRSDPYTRPVGPLHATRSDHARDRSDPCMRSVGPLHAIGRTLTCDRSDPYTRSVGPCMRPVGPLHAIGRTGPCMRPVGPDHACDRSDARRGKKHTYDGRTHASTQGYNWPEKRHATTGHIHTNRWSTACTRAHSMQPARLCARRGGTHTRDCQLYRMPVGPRACDRSDHAHAIGRTMRVLRSDHACAAVGPRVCCGRTTRVLRSDHACAAVGPCACCGRTMRVLRSDGPCAWPAELCACQSDHIHATGQTMRALRWSTCMRPVGLCAPRRTTRTRRSDYARAAVEHIHATGRIHAQS
jgi:hypothetical protein